LLNSFRGAESLGAVSGAQVVICRLPRQLLGSSALSKQLTFYYANSLDMVLLDYRLDKKWSTVGFCSGAVSGLVAITPASGFVPAWSAVIFGVVGAVTCNYATKLKYLIGVDDALDIFGEHSVGESWGIS
jgi:ammonia channel protein AmtB